MPITASAILGVGSGIGKLVQGAGDVKKAKEELAGLEKPFYDIQDEYYENKNLAGTMAQSGLPAATQDYLTTESQRGLGTTIGAINQTGGNPNDYARILDVYNNSIKKTAAEDAASQIGNIKYYMGVNKDLAGQKTTQWGVNEYQPYQNKLKELTERIGAGKTNMWGGIDQAIGSVAAYGTSKQNADMYSKLFGNGKGTTTDPNATFKSWEQQQERNNAAQGNYELTPKFAANKPQGDFYVPGYNLERDDIGLSGEERQALFNYLNRGR